MTLDALASEKHATVFYPLPSQSEGKSFIAKKLFLANGGGLWIQDIRNKVLFFDGSNILPKRGSALGHQPEQLAYLDNYFWSFLGSDIYRSSPKQKRELVFSLPPGSEIQKIGASKRFIWVTDQVNFYSFNVDTSEFITYSLMELYQHSSQSNIQINDARFVYKKWVLATTLGAYVSNQNNFDYVENSEHQYSELLYFSEKRRELIVGSKLGAVIFDIQNTTVPKKTIISGHVLSIAEAEQEYWIGTKDGLFIYSFLTGNVRRLDGNSSMSTNFSGHRIHSIVNDELGGMWVATEKGVFYVSLFGNKFMRVPAHQVSNDWSNNNKLMLKAMLDKAGYWFVTKSGLFKVEKKAIHNKIQYYRGKVFDFIETGGHLWLATDRGILCLDAETGKVDVDNDDLPPLLKEMKTHLLEVDSNENIMGVSKQVLWKYDLEKEKLTSIASPWDSNPSPLSDVTNVIATKSNELVIGTKQGLYILKEGQVRLIEKSISYGRVISIIEVQDNVLWVASNYGLFQFDLAQDQLLSLPMVDEHATPKCLMKNDSGVWVTSSMGLSRYNIEGEKIGHYGQPFGLINNEFVAGFCSTATDKSSLLVLGSLYNLIYVDTDALSVSKLPSSRVILSQIRVNQSLVGLGVAKTGRTNISYGDSIDFQFGVLPQIGNVVLEYRINDEIQWKSFDGAKLTFARLLPGDYRIDIRPTLGGNPRGSISSYYFSVSKPWFISSYAIASYVFALLTLGVSFTLWRSRRMRRANRDLKAQIALKTEQLRHQSRILLSNNHKLRKQLHVRRLIFSQAIISFKERLQQRSFDMSDDEIALKIRISDQISAQLELLLNVRAAQDKAVPVYNLSLILDSAINGWTEEFTKEGISIDVHSSLEKQQYVTLDYFNLDEVFNLLFDGVLRRCSREQVVYFSSNTLEDKLTLIMTDYGSRIDEQYHQSHQWNDIRSLVTKSGGDAKMFCTDEKNIIELTWLCGLAFDEMSVFEVDSVQLNRLCSEQDSDPWIEKLEKLVADNFSDSEFSTSAAAKMMFVSERSLQRRFKSATTRTFTDYLNEVRLDHACRRLLAGDKVSDAAFECGFNDPSYFSKRFKHRFGVPPTQFVEDREYKPELTDL
ncbi:helix-turn-helix domain-containing protein [Vibrio sinensis]|uniref:Helix-turn-helix domain-containing protein n=1 Tax=Vibrio sinensis TaxID=2302434 RepID=A0A3A6QN00_9VIBR|nr:helix-turn-helix domain-containing protein [Vibrio sinensis]